MPIIEVLGPGCSKCILLTKRTEEAVQSLGGGYEIKKIEDYAEIMSRGVMSTPALVVDGVVKMQGHVPSATAIAELLQKG